MVAFDVMTSTLFPLSFLTLISFLSLITTIPPGFRFIDVLSFVCVPRNH